MSIRNPEIECMPREQLKQLQIMEKLKKEQYTMLITK